MEKKEKLVLSKAQMQAVCRYEITFKELVTEAGLDPELFKKDEYEIVCPEIYTFTLADLEIAIHNLKKINPRMQDFGEYWLSVINLLWDEFDMDRACGYLEDADDTPEELKGFLYLNVTDSSHFDDIWTDLQEAWDDSYEDEEDSAISDMVDFDSIRAELEHYASNKGKPLEEWQFSEQEMENYIRAFEDDRFVKKAADKAIVLCRKFIEMLCEKGNRLALHIKGYACYGGNRLYDCDWPASRDCILKLFESTDDPVYANTLGYIYYYGRCTGGVPEYEKAFHYFEIAALNGLYEGTYKLADMYAHGYGCKKSMSTARSLYSQVYYENRQHFIKGEDAVFADAALRMGNVWADGLGTGQNPIRAYEYYLQADYAAKIRAKHDDFFGNTTVVMNVQKALEKTERELPEDYFHDCIDAAVPYIFEHLASDNNRCTLTRQKKENGDIELTAERKKTKSVPNPEQLLITLSSIRYCERTRKFTYTAIAPKKIWFKGTAQKVRYDYCSWNSNMNRYEFYYDDELTAWIKCDTFRVYAPKKVKASGGYRGSQRL